MFILTTFTLTFKKKKKIFITLVITIIDLEFRVEGWTKVFEMWNLEF